MAKLTVRLPDAHRDRLKAMAAQRGLSLNRLMEEISVRSEPKLVIRTLDVAHKGFRELTAVLGAAESVHQVMTADTSPPDSDWRGHTWPSSSGTRSP